MDNRFRRYMNRRFARQGGDPRAERIRQLNQADIQPPQGFPQQETPRRPVQLRRQQRVENYDRPMARPMIVQRPREESYDAADDDDFDEPLMDPRLLGNMYLQSTPGEDYHGRGRDQWPTSPVSVHGPGTAERMMYYDYGQSPGPNFFGQQNFSAPGHFRACGIHRGRRRPRYYSHGHGPPSPRRRPVSLQYASSPTQSSHCSGTPSRSLSGSRQYSDGSSGNYRRFSSPSMGSYESSVRMPVPRNLFDSD